MALAPARAMRFAPTVWNGVVTALSPACVTSDRSYERLALHHFCRQMLRCYSESARKRGHEMQVSNRNIPISGAGRVTSELTRLTDATRLPLEKQLPPNEVRYFEVMHP